MYMYGTRMFAEQGALLPLNVPFVCELMLMVFFVDGYNLTIFFIVTVLFFISWQLVM